MAAYWDLSGPPSSSQQSWEHSELEPALAQEVQVWCFNQVGNTRYTLFWPFLKTKPARFLVVGVVVSAFFLPPLCLQYPNQNLLLFGILPHSPPPPKKCHRCRRPALHACCTPPQPPPCRLSSDLPLLDPASRSLAHLMAAPMRKPSLSKSIWMNLPNLDELSFRTVRALPNASRIGLLCKTCLRVSMSESERFVCVCACGFQKWTAAVSIVCLFRSRLSLWPLF